MDEPAGPRKLTCVCGNRILYHIRPPGALEADDIEVVALYAPGGAVIARCPRCGREVSPSANQRDEGDGDRVE